MRLAIHFFRRTREQVGGERPVGQDLIPDLRAENFIPRQFIESCIQYSIDLVREVAMSVRLNITMDDDVYARLKKEVPLKKLSAFISGAVRAKLHPDVRALNVAYKAASKERWRSGLAEDWKHVDAEGWPK